MRAIIQDAYGPPDTALALGEVDSPTIRDDEVLVRVAATAVAGDDWHLTQGLPYVARIVTGMRRPRHRVPGREVAGTVAAVGSATKRFSPGDEVFGWCVGAFAEYAAVAEHCLAPKPENISSAEAAVIPISGMTALQALRDKGQIRAGARVLIIGASGGVGTFAVQIAKTFNAHVTGVCSTANLDLVRSLGADQVVDYSTTDYTQPEAPYDIIVDLVGDRSLGELRRALPPTGTLVLVGGTGGRWLKGTDRFARGIVASPFTRQRLLPLIHEDRADDLATLRALAESRSLVPVVSATYPLEDVPKAILHYRRGHARGKVAVTVEQSTSDLEIDARRFALITAAAESNRTRRRARRTRAGRS
jgi:NADPH:quinone reductase-like Zn-dependent oxidoreductase